MHGRSAPTLLCPGRVRSSAAVLIVCGALGCGHGSASSARHSRVAATAPSTIAPPPVCRLPDGEEPNCSCDEGDCAAKIGVLYSDDNRDGEAVRLFERACARGSALGCNNLGAFALAGRGGPVDAAKAHRLFDRACRLRDPSACYNLGVIYEQGDGVVRDPLVGAELLQEACKLRMAHACTSLAILYADRKIDGGDDERARALLEQACDGGDGEGCTMLALRYTHDVEQARQLMVRACEAGDAHACELLR